MYVFQPYEALTEQRELPDPFMKSDGTRVSSPEEWPAQRGYLKAMLAHYLYGEMPPDPGNVEGAVIQSEPALEGKALCERVHLCFGPAHGLALDITIYRPDREGQFPVLIWNDFGAQDSCPILEEFLERGVAVVRFDKTQLGVDGFQFVKQSANV